MPTFEIYHPAHDTRTGTMEVFPPDRKFTLNWNKLRTIPFTKVAEVEATDLDDAWEKSQNGISEEETTYEKLGVRSTSVGDIIREPDGTYQFIESIGFKNLDNPVIV